MIKTSKVKQVVQAKPYTNSYGTTIYHHLLMDNGDKIDIGKKTEMKPGYELTYEIVDSGQEYNKAKAAKLDQPTGLGGELPTSTANGKVSYNNEAEQKRQDAIILQNCYTQANAFLGNMGFGGSDEGKALDKLEGIANSIFDRMKNKIG